MTKAKGDEPTPPDSTSRPGTNDSNGCSGHFPSPNATNQGLPRKSSEANLGKLVRREEKIIDGRGKKLRDTPLGRRTVTRIGLANKADNEPFLTRGARVIIVALILIIVVFGVSETLNILL